MIFFFMEADVWVWVILMPGGSPLCAHSLSRAEFMKRSVCVREQGSTSTAAFPPKDSGTQCETEKSAPPWDKYRLDIARGS